MLSSLATPFLLHYFESQDSLQSPNSLCPLPSQTRHEAHKIKLHICSNHQGTWAIALCKQASVTLPILNLSKEGLITVNECLY